MLSVRGLAKSYHGVREIEAVKDVSFELQDGSFLAVVGRSGSGKSTLLGMIGGISRPTSGSFTIDKIDPWSLDDNARSDFRNRSIGFVFQFASLLPTLRAIDNVALPAMVGGVLDSRDAYARAHALLDRVGLPNRFDAYPSQLSGGEQRRVAIARALINSPTLLLADEPTADLDEQTESEILELLLDIRRGLNLTMMVVTHNPSIASRADQILSTRNGEVAAIRQQAVPAPFPLPEGSRAAKIFEIVSESSEPVRLGEGLERFLGRFMMWAIPMVVLVWGINAGIARYQRNLIDAKIDQRAALEQLAMAGLRAEVKDITFGAGGSYVVTIFLWNTTGNQPIYVMSPTVRGFVQVGSNWQEVPLRPADSREAQVLKITGKQEYQYILEPDVRDFEQLLPYYMHVRFANNMLVSPRSQPKDDIVERDDNYYVYLKPHQADDTAILRKVKFPGPPPVWIPMPPH